MLHLLVDSAERRNTSEEDGILVRGYFLFGNLLYLWHYSNHNV